MKQVEPTQIDPLDELWFRKPIRQHVFEFAIVFATLLTLFAALATYKHGVNGTVISLIAGAMVLVVLGQRAPGVLHPLWKGWMKLAHGLSVVMTALILSIAWVVALLPTALGLRVFQKRMMDMSYDVDRESYWEEREPKENDFKLLERQY